MLDVETRRRIDAARDILVGKVPDPKSQVEQITIALIYKFMWDIEAQSEELGGKRTFFVGNFARFAWPELMHPRHGGQQTLDLYHEALARIPENPGIPPLFRSIFNNAYLPYRDPETLREFLKVIDHFEYDHSERLGDAFEYLLSIMGAQGDAGQFRTPRHIIDFIVEIVNPQLYETVLDPACGTAGFLISAYKHIQRDNTDADGQSTLTPHERGRLAESFTGYDISPDMVRLSLVNMYLHGFRQPDIHEYDTLTNEERWDEYADVILANPPFMSPRGGIRPHNRFSVQSRRSEVLFVDYMAEHLTPDGRAGIIVPEGIIFQSQRAHTQLRKMLVEDYLVAVVSLPAGVFQPYSGVKTSILILNRDLARRSDRIAFFKVENDGYDLGAQRRPIDRDDLPRTARALKEFLNMDGLYVQAEDNVSCPTLSSLIAQGAALIVENERIAESGDHNLSAERYREKTVPHSCWPTVELGQVCDVFNGITSRKSEYKDCGKVKVIKVRDFDESKVHFDRDERGWIDKEINTNKYLKNGDTLMINAAHSATHVASKIGFLDIEPPLKSLPSGEITIFRAGEFVLPVFLNAIVRSDTIRQSLKHRVKGIHIYPRDIKKIEIPVPPLDVQQEIVAEIESYQRVIDGARTVIDNYRPHISIDPEWPLVELGKVARLINGRAYKRRDLLREGPTPVLRVGNFFSNREWYYSDLQLDEDKYCDKGDLLYAWSASFGPRIWDGPKAIFHYHIWKIETTKDVDKKFLYYLLDIESEKIKADGHGIAMIHATKSGMERREFPIPPIAIQQSIVAELEAEESLVMANHELIQLFGQKIQSAIARVWGNRQKG